MYSFVLSIAALIVGYMIYGRVVERIFKPDESRVAPSIRLQDGVDYIPMPTWKVFMIQLLNIAGTGPIFGAIMGAKFGPASYLWIVFGCIFAGAVHDYLAAMHSMRGDGLSLPQIIGHSLNGGAQKFMNVLTIVLLILVGSVFVYSPALILGEITSPDSTSAVMTWCIVIFVYYLVASVLPIDKIIGKIYPVFAFALIFMAASLFVCLLVKWPAIPEVWNGLSNLGARNGLSGMADQPILPCMFITIACGAVSGFHATQSPMMARCIKSERLGRPVFYGAMIAEGVIALIWAAVASWFFFDGGAAESGTDINESAPEIVAAVAKHWLGLFGGILALFGVVAAPITTGDTALRSARLTIADALHLKQDSRWKRLAVTIPLFTASGLLLWYNVSDENGFNVIWRYFGWINQTLAAITLWALTAHMARRRKDPAYLITLIPACFMTAVCTTFISIARIGFNVSDRYATAIFASVFVVSAVVFFIWKRRRSL